MSKRDDTQVNGNENGEETPEEERTEAASEDIEETASETEEVEETSEAAAASEETEERLLEAGEQPLMNETDDDDIENLNGDEGMLALFEHPDDIMSAAAAIRDRDFKVWDVYTPFPVHGMDEAMGIGRSWMPYATFGFAMLGLATALGLQFGTMTFDWPIIIGGKPFAPWPSFMPIAFELTVLFAGIGTAVTMIRTAGLPTLEPRILHKRLSSDRFGLWISAQDGQYDTEETRALLESLEPLEVKEVKSVT